MKKFFNKIKISKWFLFYFILLFLFPIGKISFWLFLMVLIHELFHILVACILKYSCDSVTIYPFGMRAIINHIEYMNMFHAILIIVAGPLSHFFFIFLLRFSVQFHLISIVFYDYLMMMNYSMMVFNLLPIYPLDGGRLLQLFLQLFFTYEKANFYTYCISNIMIIFFALYMNQILIYMIMIHFLIQNKIWINQKLIRLYQFYEYRYDHPVRYPIIYHEHQDLYRGCMNVIKYHNSYFYEKQWLKWKLHR